MNPVYKFIAATSTYSLLRDFYYIPKLYNKDYDGNESPLMIGDKISLSIVGILSTPIYGCVSLYDDINRLHAYYDKSLYSHYKDYYDKKIFPYSLPRNYICKDPNIIPK